MIAKSYRREWIGFGVMSLGLFMALLDIQIVASALAKISQQLQSPLDELSWIQTAYLITEVIAIAMSGRLARAMSTRWLFTAAAAGFALTSLGCALSHSFVSLIVWRSLQGYTAGTIIPTVFAAGYKMFPKRLHPRAIIIAGVVAMLAPSIGPYIGGYIAEKLDWNWLFYVNIPIGIVIAVVTMRLVRVDEPDREAWKTVDLPGFAALSIGLTALQTLLKIAPEDHWADRRDYALVAATLACGAFFVRRCTRGREPLVDLAPLRHVGFSIACIYNFVLGMGLFGSLYVLPVFLGLVRDYTPLEIGIIMTVMGVSQLAAAPFATIADRRLPARVVVFLGFALFGAGALMNAHQTPTTDFKDLVWPQILRGAALLFCILPITNVALDELPSEELSNASGLLNFMRNVGGAIGIGVVDTIIRLRPPDIAKHLLDRLVAGDVAAATFVGVPVSMFQGVDVAHQDPDDIVFIKPFLERASETAAFNEAWVVLGCILLASLVFVPFLRRRGLAPEHAPEPILERLAHEIPYVVP